MAFSTFMFTRIVQRAPTAAETATYTALSTSGQTDTQVMNAIINTPEVQDYVATVIRGNQGLLGRVPDQVGLDHNVDLIRPNSIDGSNPADPDTSPGPNPPLSLLDLFRGMLLTPEAQGLYGLTTAAQVDSTASPAFIQALYLNVLGRTGSADEVAAWQALNQSHAQVAIGFTQSQEYINSSQQDVTAFLQAAGAGTQDYVGDLQDEFNEAPASFNIASNTSTVNEGNTATFTVSTTNVAAGTVLDYTITGVQAADVLGGTLTGQVTIGADGKGTITVGTIADQLTEGDEVMTVTLDGKLVSAGTTVIDTSKTQTFDVKANGSDAPAAVNEGGTVIFTLSTAEVAAGTSVGYTISGIDADDVVGGASKLSGTFVVDGSGFASVAIQLTNDSTTEGSETATLALDNGKDVVNVDINDTSLDPTFDVEANVASVNEGGTVTFNLETTGLAAGTSVSYSISGVDADDVVGGAGTLTGAFVVDGNGKASVSVQLANDQTTEGLEFMTLKLNNAADAAIVTVNDTSVVGSLNFTTLTDSLVGTDGDDKFQAGLDGPGPLNATFQGLDTADGKLGTDSIFIETNKSASPLGLGGIELWDVTNNGGGAITLGLGKATEMTNLNVRDNAAAGDGITFNGLVDTTVAIAMNNITSNNTFNFAAASGTPVITLNNVTGGADVNVGLAGVVPGSLQLVSDGATPNSIETGFAGPITITGGTNLTLTDVGAASGLNTGSVDSTAFLGNLTILASGGVGFDGPVTLNAGIGSDVLNGSIFTDTINGGEGFNTINGLGGFDTITSGDGGSAINPGGSGFVTTGAGTDALTLGGGGTLTANLGAGNDTFTAVVGGGEFDSTESIDGDKDTDTAFVEAGDLVAASGVADGNEELANFENLDTGTLGAATTLNVPELGFSFTQLNIDGTAGAVTILLNGGAQTLRLDAGIGGALKIDAAGAAVDDTLLIQNNTAGLDVFSTKDLTVTDFETTTYDISPFFNVFGATQTFGTVDVGAANKLVVIETNTGLGASDITITKVIAAELDASAITGDLTATAGLGPIVLTGGSGDDTLTLFAASGGTANGGLGNDILTGDAGDFDDTLNGGDGDDLITTGDGDDTVDGGAGNDRVVMGKFLDGIDKSIDGGADVDTLVVDMPAAGFAAADLQTTKNFEIVEGTILADTAQDVFNFAAFNNDLIAFNGIFGAGDFNLALTNAMPTFTTLGIDGDAKNVSVERFLDNGTNALTVNITSQGAFSVDKLTVDDEETVTLNNGTDATVADIDDFQGADLATLNVISTGTGAPLGTGSVNIDALTAAGLNKVDTTGTNGDVSIVQANDAGAVTWTSGTGANTYDGSVNTGVLTFTGNTGDDTVLGGTKNDVLNMGAGADEVTGGLGIDGIDVGAADGALDLVHLNGITGTANRDNVANFEAGAGLDQVEVNDADSTKANAGVSIIQDETTAPPAALLFDTSVSDVLEFSFDMGGDGTVRDLDGWLDGTGLLASLAETLSVAANTDSGFVLAYEGGNAYLWHVLESAGDADADLAATDFSLIGVFTGIAVGAFDVDNIQHV